MNGPGLSYEVSVALRENQIVWVGDPLTPNTHDLTAYRRPGGLKDIMENNQPNKLALGDDAYRGEPNTVCTRNEFDSPEAARIKARGKAQGETINACIKIFNVLDERFRHTGDNRIEAHRLAFTAVCPCAVRDRGKSSPV
jgi:hypothetical protein